MTRRATEILIAAAAAEPDPAYLMAAVCSEASRELKCISVTVGFVAETVPLTTVAASGGVGVQLDIAQNDLGEGPSCLAATKAEFVSCDDLTQQRERWPLFVQSASEAGVGAAFVFPIAPDDALIATLTLYRSSGSLAEADHAAAIDYVAAVALVLLHTEQIEPNGGVFHNPGAPRWIVVQQAIGMLSVQLDLSLSDAHARLRARAYAEGVPLSVLARDVVNRKLRFTPDDMTRDDAGSDQSQPGKNNQEEQ